MDELASLNGSVKADGDLPDGFDEPVLRCDSCQALMRRTTIRTHGACKKCGNKRMRNVAFMNETERDEIAGWGFHKFLERFEAVQDDD
jgi:hypothetical protein